MALFRRLMLTDTLHFRRNFESWSDVLYALCNIDVDARIGHTMYARAIIGTHVRAKEGSFLAMIGQEGQHQFLD